MKNAQCKKCLNKFQKKDIYTIQQFQYRKQPSYDGSRNYFKRLQIDEWDSFCENCIKEYADESKKAWKNN